MELILSNLSVENVPPVRDLTALDDYAGLASRILDYPMAPNLAVVGEEAFNTGSGVHAAAIRKALDMGRPDLAALVYSPFDPHLVNREAGARVGIMSGRSNVLLKLKALNLEPSEADIEAVMRAAKDSSRSLTDAEIRRIVSRRSRLSVAAHPHTGRKAGASHRAA
jgi:2-isopropylmalate synthase